MTRINQLSVKNIRSHHDLTVNFSDDTTVITGNNGSGKTSILEAIYIVLRGSSFKGSDRDILNNNSSWWRIDAVFSNLNAIVKFDSAKDVKKKQFEIDDKISYRIPINHKKPIVLFEPDDLRLIHGSPSKRRLFVDRFISQLDRSYSSVLTRYEKAIRQRNALLQKDYLNEDELFAWNVILSDYGSEIVSRRIDYLNMLNKTFNSVYSQISNQDINVEVIYSHQSKDFSSTALLHQLNLNLPKDKILKSTSVGPHRHDVIFNYSNKLASKVVSRGEARTMILSLKLSELTIVKEVTDENPLVLLDDVFSELDQDRQISLSEMTSGSQMIITSAHIPESLKSHQIKLG